MRLVLDTNIVIDMLHFSDPHTQALRIQLENRSWQCFTDTNCLAELARVSAYPAFGLDHAAQHTLLTRYHQLATCCDAVGEESYLLPRCRDGDDQKFLILASRCRADLLLTRDKQLLKLAHHRRLPPPFGIMTAAAADANLRRNTQRPASDAAGSKA